MALSDLTLLNKQVVFTQSNSINTVLLEDGSGLVWATVFNAAEDCVLVSQGDSIIVAITDAVILTTISGVNYYVIFEEYIKSKL